MTLAFNGTIPPKEFYHDPELRDNKFETVSILLANKGVIPP